MFIYNYYTFSIQSEYGLYTLDTYSKYIYYFLSIANIYLMN